jgi:hypothetical protein
MFENYNHHDKPKCKVKYSLQATLHTRQGDLKYKQWLIIHERPVEFQADKLEIQNKEISTWCCVGQGHGELTVQF